MKPSPAIGILRDCEHALRSLLSAAAAEGDYAEVQKLAELAQTVAALAAEQGRVESAPDGAPVGTAKPAKTVKEAFPQFFRRGDELVKVGWSKKEKRKYHHRAPRRVVSAVATAVRSLGNRGRSFTGNALLPLADPDGGVFVPYQVYVALAWLAHLGLVKTIGQRGGYALPSEKSLDAALTAAWPALPEWAG